MDTGRPLNVVKAELFKGLAHPVRIRILELLSEAEAEELSVGVLIDALGLEASHVSQHLRVLRGYDLVTSERRGSQVYYRLAHHSVVDMLSAARTLLGELLESRAALIAD